MPLVPEYVPSPTVEQFIVVGEQKQRIWRLS